MGRARFSSKSPTSCPGPAPLFSREAEALEANQTNKAMIRNIPLEFPQQPGAAPRSLACGRPVSLPGARFHLQSKIKMTPKQKQMRSRFK